MPIKINNWDAEQASGKLDCCSDLIELVAARCVTYLLPYLLHIRKVHILAAFGLQKRICEGCTLWY